MAIKGKGYSFKSNYHFRELKDVYRAFQNLAEGLGRIGRANFQFVQGGWTTPENYEVTRTFDANNTSLNELADVVATLIEDQKQHGSLSE